MHNAAMCTLSLYDVIGKNASPAYQIKSFFIIAQPLHKEAVRGWSFFVYKRLEISDKGWGVSSADVSIY